MAKDDQAIPTEDSKHHTWKTAPDKKYQGRHRASDRKPENGPEEDKK